MYKRLIYIFFSALLLQGCKSAKIKCPDATYTFKIIQLNDVYEISPLQGGKVAGLARVAHAVDSIKLLNKNTFLVMAGDFLNPSLIGSLKIEGEKVLGKQMIEVMNAMDFEVVTFGNHEFDIGESALQQRMNESNFYWTSANCFQQTQEGPRSFYFIRKGDTLPVPETYTLQIKQENLPDLDVGLFGVTLPSNPRDFVYYSDYILEAGAAVSKLKSQQIPIILGLTHLEIEQDKILAQTFPELSLIMGGHEHHHTEINVGNTKITKADANAKSIYIHTFTFNNEKNDLKINSQLLYVNNKTPEKTSVKQIVNKWEVLLENQLKQIIDSPNDVIYITKNTIDGTDALNRNSQTTLGSIITQAMALSFNSPLEAAIVNSGSFRLDDNLEGAITGVDIFRVLPFGGEVIKVTLTGQLLIEVLDYGFSKRGQGAYLQLYNLDKNQLGQWTFNDVPIQNNNTYTIACSDFLLKGYDIPFLNLENKGVLKVEQPLPTENARDIRLAVIHFLKNLKK